MQEVDRSPLIYVVVQRNTVYQALDIHTIIVSRLIHCLFWKAREYHQSFKILTSYYSFYYTLGCWYPSLHSLSFTLFFSPPSPHPFAPLHFLPVSFILSAHWSVSGAETPGRLWICCFLETPGHSFSRDPLTSFSKSSLCSCALWAPSSSSASCIPNCHRLPQWPRCRYRIKKEHIFMLFLLD